MTRCRLCLAALTATILLGVLPAAAGAAGVELSEAQSSAFPDKSFVLTLPERRSLAAQDVTVRENGRPVEGVQVVPGGAAGASTFGTMLVIDTSDSMLGAPIAAAMDAARQFAARRPAQQRLGIVFFNRTPTVALPPTTDAKRIAAALSAAPPLQRGTAIFDATALAMRELARSAITVGSVVVLSDGADVGSSIRPSAVAEAAHRSKTRIFTVGLRSRAYRAVTLTDLAASGGGQYAEANPQRLAALFAALGSRFGREYLLSYRSLAPLGSTVSVTASVAGIGTASAGYRSPALRPPGAAPTGTAGAKGFVGSSLASGLAVLLGALLVGVAAYAVTRPRHRTLRTRIEEFTGAVDGQQELDAALAEIRGGDLTRDKRRRTPSRRWLAFAEDVDVSRLAVKPEQLALWTVALATILVVLGVLAGNAFLGLLVLVVIPVGMRLFVSSRAKRQRHAFEAQLADNLQIVASAMRAGQSFTGALAVAVEDALEPAKAELQRAVTDERLGVSLDEALARVARRMRSEELEYVGLVATLQRETGGNTAEVLDRVTETIRERAELKRLVRTLTAQGRLGGGIVSALPLALTAFFVAVKPGYFDPLLNNAAGVFLMTLGAGMVLSGWLLIRKIVDIKV